MNTPVGTNGNIRTARDAAVHWLRCGVYPVPVESHGKRPWDCDRNRPRTAWEKLRVTEADIDSLFAPDGNVGLLLGSPSSGLVDLDLDALEARHAASHLLPPTDLVGRRESASSSHFFYLLDSPPEKASDQYRDPCAPEGYRNVLLELRSTGGQTVVAPSVYGADAEKGHERPERFVWARHGTPAPVAAERLQTAARAVAAAALLARYWPRSSRHDAALALAGGLLRAGWLEELVVKFVTAICAAANDTELDNRIGCVRDTAASLTNSSGNKVTGWPSLARVLGERGEILVRTVTTWLRLDPSGSCRVNWGASSANSAWPPPIPLSTPPAVPAYPCDALPARLRAWAEAVAVELQVPVDLPAALGLGLVAAGIARKVVVRPRVGFTEPTNQFVMVMLPPGERKTQAFRRAIAPVQELQREAREATAPVILEAESEYRIAEKAVKHLEDKIAKAPPDEKVALREELKTAREELAKAEVPAQPLFYSEDDTPESLKLELVRQGGRMMMATTEAKCLENITLYAERPNFDVYLKGHAGDEINSGRISRGRDTVTDPALSCLLAPQPAVLQGLAENEILRGRGFLARWFYLLPVSRVGHRAIAAAAVPDELQAEYARLIRRAWETDYATAGGEPGPSVIGFAPEAATEFEAFEAWVEPQLAPGYPLARLAGWGNKLNGACARLAAALHVAEALERGAPWAEPVTAETARRAIRLCRDYFVPHAVAAFDLMGADTTVAGARRVWQWIESERLAEFSKRDAFNANRAEFETVDNLQPCLDLLERHYLIRQRPSGEEKRRGRPSSPIYDVNPGTGERAAPPHPPTEPPYAPKAEPHPAAHNSQKAHKSGADESDGNSALSANCARQEPERERPAPAHTPPPAEPHGAAPGGSASRADNPFVVRTQSELTDTIAAIRATSAVGIDIETTGLNHARDRARVLSVATPTGTFVIDLFGTDPSALWPHLNAVEVVGHNLGFDLPFLMRLGFVPGTAYDTMLASQVLHAGDRTVRHALKDLAHRHLGCELDKELQKDGWAGPLTPERVRYAALDAELPLRLKGVLEQELSSAKLTGTAGTEMAALNAVAWASRHGVGLDRPAWEALVIEAETEADTLRNRLDEMAPNPGNLFGVTNWNSPDDVKTAFAALGTHLTGTDDDMLATVAHPAAGVLREYRGAAKRTGTYGREWLRHVAPDGRVYANWRQIGAGASGRMSCKEPNLQQLPRDLRYRRCFTAPPGRVLVKADYSQIELRIAAKLTGDKRMLDAYRAGEDIHTLTARALLGKRDVTKADRQLAKAINFGLLYGMGARNLTVYARSNFDVALTEEDATKHRDTFFRTYPGLKRWHRSTRDGSVETRTLTGRRRAGVTSFTEKLNTPVQGTGADGLKRALALLWERRGERPDAFPLLYVHDEIVIETDEEKAEAAAEWLKAAMLDGMAALVAPVPVEVEVSVARTWGG